MGKVYVGCSGFNYKHWKDGVFYPKGLQQKEWLEFYSKQFNCVELNVTFYQLPKKYTFQKWAQQVPDNFKFTVKGSRFITHIKKLNGVEDSLNLFSESIAGLGQKKAVVLWQFGSDFGIDLTKLKNFSKLIKKNKILRNIPHAFEFRSKSWFCSDVYELLRVNNFGLVIADSKKWPKAEILTADFVYVRFHGNVLFSSSYKDNELKSWA